MQLTPFLALTGFGGIDPAQRGGHSPPVESDHNRLLHACAGTDGGRPHGIPTLTDLPTCGSNILIPSVVTDDHLTPADAGNARPSATNLLCHLMVADR